MGVSTTKCPVSDYLNSAYSIAERLSVGRRDKR